MDKSTVVATAAKDPEPKRPENIAGAHSAESTRGPGGEFVSRVFGSASGEPKDEGVVGLLRSPTLSHPANDNVRAAAYMRAQQSYGNRFVQRSVGDTRRGREATPTNHHRRIGSDNCCAVSRVSEIEVNASPVAFLQRQTDSPPADSTPEQDPNAPQIPPEVQRQLVYAATVLRRVPALPDEKAARLDLAIGGSELYRHIVERKGKREELEELKRKPPGLAEMGTYGQRVELLTKEVEKLDALINSELTQLNISNEDDLVNLVEQEFPKIWIDRAKTIAYTMLDQNTEVVTKEMNRYQTKVCSPDIQGLRDADAALNKLATELSAMLKDLDQKQAKIAQLNIEIETGEKKAADARREGSLPGGKPPTEEELRQMRADRDGLETEAKALRPAIDAKAAEIQETRDNHGVKYPVLFAPDYKPGSLYQISPEELEATTGAWMQQILENIEKSRKNIADDTIWVWDLRDVPALTFQSLGVQPNSVLGQALTQYKQGKISDKEALQAALTALAIAAGVVATVATMGGALLVAAAATGLGAGLTIGQLILHVEQYQAESAATHVALDPLMADISINDPEILPIVMDVIALGLDAVAVMGVLRAASRAAMIAGDMDQFAAAARRALPPAQADALITQTTRRLGKAGAAQLPGPYTALATKEGGDAFKDVEMATIPLREHPNLAGIQSSLRPIGATLVADSSLPSGTSANVLFIRITGPGGETFTRALIRYNPEKAVLQDLWHELNHLQDFQAGRIPPSYDIVAEDAAKFSELQGKSVEELRQIGKAAAPKIAEMEVTKLGESQARKFVAEMRNHLRDIEELSKAGGTGYVENAQKAVKQYRELLGIMVRTGNARGARLLTEVECEALAKYIRQYIEQQFPELPSEFSNVFPKQDFWSFLQRKPLRDSPLSSAAVVQAQTDRSAGSALEPAVRHRMETHLGTSFEEVRVHTGARAAGLSEALRAEAFTRGRDIYFAAGHYHPESVEGGKLLAHELTHVMQQRRGATPKAGIGEPDGPLEREANRAADMVAKGESDQSRRLTAKASRQTAPEIARRPLPTSDQCSVQRQPAGQTAGLGGDALADVLPPPVEMTWGTDTFQIDFQRGDGDSDRVEFIIHYTGSHPAEGPFVQNKSQRVGVSVGPTALKGRVINRTDASLEVDLYSDRSRIAKLRDDPRFDARPFKKGREHDFTLSLNGKFAASASLWVLDPRAQASDIKPAIPEISPGTTPGTTVNPADGAYEIRVDGDGDQYPELLLRMNVKHGRADMPVVQQSGSQVTRVALEIIHISTGEKLLHTDFDAPTDQASTIFLPVVKQVSDGKAATTLSLFVPEESGDVEIHPPDLTASDPQYRLVAYGRASSIPYRGKGEIRKVASADQPIAIGNIVSTDVALGAYGDRFRITLQPTSTEKVIFGISALSKGGPVGGMGVELQFNKPIRLRCLETDPTSLGLDLDNDGQSDLLIFDQLTTPDPVDGGGPPESNRNHRIRLTGPVSGGDKFFDFKVRDNYLSGGYASPGAADKTAESNALAVTSLGEQENLVDKLKGKLDATGEIDAIDRLLAQLRRRAFDEKLIRPETFNAWDQLARDFILLDPQIKAHGVDATLQRDGAIHAQKFYDELAIETKSAEKPVGAHGIYVTTNPYTDLNAARDLTPGQELAADIRAGRWDSAISRYAKLVDGLDRWIAAALQKKYGAPDKDRPDSNLAGNVEYLAGLRRGLSEVQVHNPTRIAAVFHPDERNVQTGRINEIPLSLYYWRDGDTWHLKDATDDDGPNETASVGSNETEPPYALFLKLAESPHYPAGIIHYQMPGGAGGQVHPTGPGTWRKVLTWIGIGAAAIGLGLVTFGEGTIAVIGAYALGGSAVLGGGMALLDLVERGIHGNLSAQTAILDSAQIVAAVSGLGVLRAGRILSVARAAAAESTPLTESAALSVQWAMRYVVPLAGVNVGADTITLAVFTEEAAKQFDAIDKMPGTDDSRQRAKLLLIGQMAVTVGLTALSIRGNVAEITYGRNFDIVIVKGVPVAIPKGASVMGEAVIARRPGVSPDVDEATFFARERAHLEGIRSEIRAPGGERGAGGESLAQVEDLALRTAWRNEETRRILEPIEQGSRSLAGTDATFRKQLGQFLSEAQAIIDSPSVTPTQKQAALRALVRAFQTAHPPLKSNVDFSAVDVQIGRLGGEGAAGIMVADPAGNLLREGQASGTLQELLERVARANNASAAHGIGIEYVVEMKPGETPGTTRVEITSRPRSPSITAYSTARAFTGVPERAQTVAETLTRLRSLHSQSRIEVLSADQIRINGQLELTPSDLQAMPNEDVTNLLKWTKELQSHDGNVNALGDGKKILAALTKKYRLRFEYERQQVDEMLRRLGLVNSDGTSRHAIFENMSTVDRNRLFSSVLKADLPSVETTAGSPTDPALRSQAIDYALARNPESVAAFVRHFEFYLAEFTRRADAQFEAFASELERRLSAAGGDESKRESLKAALMKEMGVKSLQAGLRGKVLAEMGAAGDPLAASSATRAEVAGIYDRMATAVGSRFGHSQIKLQPGEMFSSLSPEEVVHRIQALGDEVTFGTLEAAVYHARKHVNELPPSDIVKSAQGTVLPENEVESYLKSLATTIRNPAKSATEIANASKTQGDSRSYEFSRENLRAVVYVNNEGKITVATYGR